MMFNSPSMNCCNLLLAYCSFKDGIKELCVYFGRNSLPWEKGRWLSAYLVVNPAKSSFSFIMGPLYRWAIVPPSTKDKNTVHSFPILGPNCSEATKQTGRFERSQHLNCVVLWIHRQWQRGRWSNFSVVHGRPEFLVVPLSWRSQDSPNTRGHWTRSRGYGNDDDDDENDDDDDDDGDVRC